MRKRNRLICLLAALLIAVPAAAMPATAFGQSAGDVCERKSRAIGDDKLTSAQERFRLTPFCNVNEGIDSYKDVEPVALPQAASKGPNGVDSVTGVSGLLWIGRFQQGWYKLFLACDAEGHHRIAVNVSGDGSMLLERLDVRRHEQHFAEREALHCSAGHCKVAAVNRIKCPTK